MNESKVESLFGRRGESICARIRAASEFLAERGNKELLPLVGGIIDRLPEMESFDNRCLQKSSRKSEDHFLTGKGLFFLTEQGRLVLDCTAGHYQMPWGYDPPLIKALISEAMDAGVPWDCHSDIPGNPVKALAEELIAVANGLDSFDAPEMDAIVEGEGVLNRVVMSACTGTVACAAAFRMALVHYQNNYADLGAPVFITFKNNYHGTDTFAQAMRGMWPGLFNDDAVKFVQVTPNGIGEIESVFAEYGKRVACFFFEPVMMNNEAVLIEKATVEKMRELTTRADAMLVVDEIQSCFFVPELMMFRQYDMIPDAVVVGKGMTAGFHGQAATVFRSEFDVLAQFDALSTNGNAPLAAVAGLACINEIKRNRAHLGEMQDAYARELREVAAEFPELIESAMGEGLLGGFKFRDREKAIAARERLLERGLWVRVHAYKENHRTLLMKFALIVEQEVIDFFFSRAREVFRTL